MAAHNITFNFEIGQKVKHKYLDFTGYVLSIHVYDSGIQYQVVSDDGSGARHNSIKEHELNAV
jgi:heat shock protein HspQ